MPYYLLQAAYTSEGVAALVKKPQDRIKVVGSAAEKLGGKVHGGWFAFGDYDVIAIIEMPDNVSAAGLSMAFAAGGALRTVKTTPLLTVDEATKAMRKAAGTAYRPPTR